MTAANLATHAVRGISCHVIDMVNTLKPRQNGRLLADETFKRIFLNEIIIILIKISRKFVPEGPIINIPALVQIMAWRRPGDKPLSEPMVVSLPTHICVIRPQWVKEYSHLSNGSVCINGYVHTVLNCRFLWCHKSYSLFNEHSTHSSM